MEDELGYQLQQRTLKREVYDWIESLMFALVFIVFLFTFVGRVSVVDGHSMDYTLAHGDRMLSTNLFYTPQNGDIVVITQPSEREEAIIKRVIAVAGQEVNIDFETGTVTIDGVTIDEPYILAPTYSQGDLSFPQTVPEGHVFVMGDNRNNSWDSRFAGIGMVDNRYVLGKTILRVTPINRFGDPDADWNEGEGSYE